jgi:hypothetical protein
MERNALAVAHVMVVRANVPAPMDIAAKHANAPFAPTNVPVTGTAILRPVCATALVDILATIAPRACALRETIH